MACLRDIVGLVPERCNKVKYQESGSHEFFGFSVHIKVIFTLYCNVCNSIMSKKTIYILIKNASLLKNVNYPLTMQVATNLQFVKKKKE